MQANCQFSKLSGCVVTSGYHLTDYIAFLRKIHVVLWHFHSKLWEIRPHILFRVLHSKFILFRLRYKWPFGISATVSYNSGRRQTVRLRQLGIRPQMSAG